MQPFPIEEHCTDAKLVFYYINRSNLHPFPIEQHCMEPKMVKFATVANGTALYRRKIAILLYKQVKFAAVEFLWLLLSYMIPYYKLGKSRGAQTFEGSPVRWICGKFPIQLLSYTFFYNILGKSGFLELPQLAGIKCSYP